MLCNFSLKNALLCLVLIIFSSACSPNPDFYLIDGQSGRLSDYHGKWLLINYWAEWCKPCIEEVPELNQFYKEYSADYAMLSVSYDAITTEELVEQVARFKMNYPMIASIPKPKLGIKMPAMLPANYLISPAGKIYGPLIGPQTVDSLVKGFRRAKTLDSEKSK